MKEVIQLSAESFSEHSPPHPGSLIHLQPHRSLGELKKRWEKKWKKNKKTGQLTGWLDARQEGVGGRAAVKLDGVSTSPRTLSFHSAHRCPVTSAAYNRVQQCDGLFQGDAVCTVISI